MTFKSFFHRHHDQAVQAAPPPPPQPPAHLHPKICYATASAGQHPTAHSLIPKIEAIAEAGIGLVEVAWQDLETMVRERERVGVSTGEDDIEKMVDAAKDVRRACERKGVKVFVLMPFSKFEGYEDKEKLEAGLERARNWFKVMKALDCEMLQVGSNDDPDISPDPAMMANDLRMLADEAAKCDPPIRIAYEMWAWGTYVNTWEHTVDICIRVDRPNFGLCLDTFQIAAHYYKHHLESSSSPTSGSPTTPTTPTFHPDPHPPIPGHFEPEPGPNADADANTSPQDEFALRFHPRPIPPPLALSLLALSRTFVDPKLRDKIFYLQVSDAVIPSHQELEGMRGPGGGKSQSLKGKEREGAVVPSSVNRKPTLEAWSDGWRVLPAEGFVNSEGKWVGGVEGAPEGSLPVVNVLRAVVETGWRGVWSYEVFYPPLHSLDDPTIPSRWARAAKVCHTELLNKLGHGGHGGHGVEEKEGVKAKDFEADGEKKSRRSSRRSSREVDGKKRGKRASGEHAHAVKA